VPLWLRCSSQPHFARADRVPSMIGVDHIGMTVPKPQEGINFFTKVLGCEYLSTAGPFSDPRGG
jgi:hypothetical protein